MENILYISPLSHIGGGEVSLLLILKHLDKERFKIRVICYSEGPVVEKARNLGIDVNIFKRSSFFSNFAIVWDIFRYIKKNNIQLVHVNTLDIRGGIAAWLARIPFIGHLRVIIPFTWRDRLFVRFSGKVIAVSNAAIDAFCGERKYLSEKFIVIPNTVEVTENLTTAPLRRDFSIPEDAKLVGAVGRIDLWKGYEYFIEAATRIKKKIGNIYFFIIGGTSAEDREGQGYLDILERQVYDLGLKGSLFFTGFREDAIETIKALDVLVVPSVVLKMDKGEVTEGFGRVAIEAMAVGVPVVASNVGGLKEIIEDRVSGLLVTPGNPEAIAGAVISLIENPELANSIRNMGKRRFEEVYTPERCIKSLIILYFNILKKK